MVATVLIAVVALIHAYIVVLEMVLWTTPRGRKAFGMSVEKAELTKVLAANQGLYNGFLVAGLAWGCGWASRGFRSRSCSWPASLWRACTGLRPSVERSC